MDDLQTSRFGMLGLLPADRLMRSCQILLKLPADKLASFLQPQLYRPISNFSEKPSGRRIDLSLQNSSQNQ